MPDSTQTLKPVMAPDEQKKALEDMKTAPATRTEEAAKALEQRK